MEVMFQQLEIGGRDVYTHTLAHICQVVVNNMEKNEVGQRWEECWGLPITGCRKRCHFSKDLKFISNQSTLLSGNKTFRAENKPPQKPQGTDA